MQAAPRRGDSYRTLRELQSRAHEVRLPDGALAPLWAAHAGRLRHPLQLLDSCRGLAGAARFRGKRVSNRDVSGHALHGIDPQLQAVRVAAAPAPGNLA